MYASQVLNLASDKTFLGFNENKNYMKKLPRRAVFGKKGSSGQRFNTKLKERA